MRALLASYSTPLNNMRWQAVAVATALAVSAQLQWTVSPTYTVCATATLRLAPAPTPTGSDDSDNNVLQTATSSRNPDTAPPPEIEHPEQHDKRDEELWDIYVYNMGVPQWSSVGIDTASYSVGSELKMQTSGAPTPTMQVDSGASPTLNGGKPVETQAPQTSAQPQPSDRPRLDGGASQEAEQQGDDQSSSEPQPTSSPSGEPNERRMLAARALINMTLIEAFGGGELQWQVNVPPGLYRLGAISTTNSSTRIASDAFEVKPGNGSACVPQSFLPKKEPALDWRAVVGIVVGGVVGIILIGLIIWWLARRCKKKRSKPLDDNFWHMYYPTRIASPNPSLAPPFPVPDYSYYGQGSGSFSGSGSGSFKPPVLPSSGSGSGSRSIRSLRSLRSKPNQSPSEKMDLDSAIHVTYNAYGPGTTPLERQVQALVEGSKNDVALEQELRGLFRANQKEHYSDLEAAVMKLLDQPGEKPLGPEIKALYESVLGRRASSAYSGFTARESLDTLRTQRPPPVRPQRPASSQLPEELGPQVQLPAHLTPAASSNSLLSRMGWRRSQQQEVMRAEVMRSPDGEKEQRVYHHLNYNHY